MNRSSLKDMSNEELWQLFPIILCQHDDNWPNLYLKEKEKILNNIDQELFVRIDHIGSTAVKGLIAKPTIDILLQIKPLTELSRGKLIRSLEDIDYIYQYQPQRQEPKMMFMKGYTINGFASEVYHLHVRYQGDDDERYFCRYLVEHPVVANEYKDLKIRLAKKFEHDRDAYTKAKTTFISHYTKIAKKLYQD